MKNNNNCMRTMVYVIICLVAAIMVGTVLMIAVYCLPVLHIRENARNSCKIYELEGDYYQWAPDCVGSKLDNFTDALMINTASFLGRGSVIYDAMMNPYITYDDLTTLNQCTKRAVEQDTLEGNVTNYVRYWHGYLIWLKPMLMFFTISDIRVINMCVQLVLLLSVILELYKKVGYKGVIPFTIAILMLNPISTALSMQHACIYYIMLISAYIMLRFRIYHSKGYWKLFLWIGIAAAFFDLLTSPVISLGIVLELMLVLQDEFLALPLQIKKIIKASFAWGIGYGGMWIGKWGVASVLTGYNVFVEGIENVEYRMSGNLLTAITNNIAQLFKGPFFVLLFIILITFGAVLLLTGKYRFKLSMTCLASMIMISLYPFVWYSLARNHSAIHAFMTYRNLSITIFAVSYIIVNSIVTVDRK